MPVARTIWLLGDAAQFEVLTSALREHGAEVERIPADGLHAWLGEVSSERAPNALPALLVVSAETAWADDGHFIRTVCSHQPWRFLPLVVVASEDDPVRCNQTYDLGAAGWVVLPPHASDLGELAATFARYWLRTTLLPDIGPHARL
mgnify:CR=1 FL=1